MNITLHQWEISPFCGKVRRILEAKGLRYQVINYNGLQAAKAARLTPIGKLPVLDIDGERIADSRLIAQELERRFPQPPLMPATPAEQAQVQVYQDWADESLYWYELHFRIHHDAAWSRMLDALSAGRPAWERAVLGMVMRPRLRSALKAQGLGRATPQQVETRFWLLMSQLDALLADRQWLVGERKSLADIAVGSQLLEVARTSDFPAQWAQRPHLHRWMGTI